MTLSASAGNILSWMAGTGANTHMAFRNNALVAPAQVGSIVSTGSATAFNTSSDATWKDDKGEMPLADAMGVLSLITFHDFEWNENSPSPGERDHGVFAQELFEVYPKAVTRGGWVNDETGLPAEEASEGALYQPWSVDYSKLVTVMGRCIQGMSHRLSALEKTAA